MRVAAASVAAGLLAFSGLTGAAAAPVALDCSGGNGSVSSALLTANSNGATATDNLSVANAPVGATITLTYTSTSNNNKRATSSLASPAASGPLPAGNITINGAAGSGSQAWTKTTGADPAINVTLTKTAAAGGAASMNWSAVCTPGRTASIANTTDGNEAGPVNGVLTVTLSAVSATDTVIALSYGGTAANNVDYTRPANVTIPAGSLSAPVTLTVLDDAIVENPETVIVTLGNVTSGSAAVVAPNSATNTITSDDVGTIVIVETDLFATETPGDTGSFDVSLGAQPSGTVTVAIGAAGQCTRAPTSLAFTTANWNVPRTVTLTPTDDAIVEGDHTCSPASITASGGGYNGVTATPPVIAITDNDFGSIVVAVTDATATEAPGNTGRFTVRLGLRPVSSVTVTIGASTQCAFSQSTLVFTTANWNTAQAVIVTPINDAVVEGPHSCSPSEISAAGGAYDGVTGTLPVINITDNDTGTLVVALTDGAASETPGDTGAFTVRLGAQPSGDVTVAIGASTQCTFSPAPLTFTDANWNAAQTVIVTPIDDGLIEGPHSCSPASISASGGGYDGVTGTPPVVTIADNDTAGLIVAGGPLTVTEAGASESFTVALTAQPSVSVTVPLTASNPAEATAAPVSLVFTSADWNVPQTVTVTGVDDAIDDGDIVSTVSVGPTTSSAAGFNGLTAPAVSVTTIDDDTAGFTVVGGPLIVTEAGSTASFTVVLSSQPAADVTVPLAASNPAEATVWPASLTFTAANWNVAQTVTVTGVDDAVDDGDVASSIAIGPASSADPLYDGRTPPAVAVTTADDDTAGIVVSGGPLTVTEAGSTASFTVVLSSHPAADVTVPLAASNAAEAVVSPTSLTFTAANWSVAQTVTVTGVDDAVDDGDVASSIAIGPSSSADPLYDGRTPPAVAVTTADDDTAGILVSGGPLTLTEAGSSATFTVVLTARPTADVTVPLAASNPAEATVSPVSLTFTPANWNVAQTVTVTGVDDAVQDGDVASSVTVGPAVSGDPAYGGLTTAAVAVTTTDDDAMIDAAVADAFGRQTHDFMARRQAVILTHEPTFHRLVNRGRAGWSKGENAVDMHAYDGVLRGSFSLNTRSVAAAFADPDEIEGDPAYDPSSALNAWAEGRFGIYSADDAASGDFFLGYAGVDWRYSESLMIGIMGELDWLRETPADGGLVEGTGWMVGPYLSYALSEKLFVDLRTMWGRSSNQAGQEVLAESYQGDFDTERWLVDARLAGLHQVGALTLQPELGLTYMKESQLDYEVAGNGRILAIDGQSVATGVLSAGAELSESIPFGAYVIEPFMRGRLLWSFDDPLGDGPGSADTLGGQAAVGLSVGGARTSFSTELTYGTLGVADLKTFAAKLSFAHVF